MRRRRRWSCPRRNTPASLAFRAFLIRLHQQRRLDRIVMDEAHLVMTASKAETVIQWANEKEPGKCAENCSHFKRNDTRRAYYLQVQVYWGCTIRTLKRLAPDSVAFALIPVDDSLTPDQIRVALIAVFDHFLQT
ncbi:MAG: hypothetical protein M1826_002702 [Phylliscum demangeonii]|nr:MAG: hypothetical protein M1826_002702 [Phylliscum demangeonii]